MANLRVPTIVLAVIGAAVLGSAVIVAAGTFIELRNPDADPLTPIGYLVAGVIAVLALLSLLLTWVSSLLTGAWWRVVLLVVAALPLVPLAILVLASAW